MRMRLIIGFVLFTSGIIISTQGYRPWIGYDFLLTWFGLLLISDSIAYSLTKKTIFSNWRNFVMLAFASSFFWWFYEWANIALKNWAYPAKPLYDSVEWGIFATAAFVTVIPHLIISTNIVSFFTKNKPVNFLESKLSKATAYFFIFLGLISLFLSIFIPVYFFPLIWIVVFFVLDPLNALAGRRSLIVQLLKKNYFPLLLLTAASLYAGFWWETINYLIPKWIYPIVPWFWTLPPPITTKYFEMPLAGFLGYIPFIFSAFAFVEFLELKIKLLGGG